jgi:hypothetical protein
MSTPERREAVPIGFAPDQRGVFFKFGEAF